MLETLLSEITRMVFTKELRHEASQGIMNSSQLKTDVKALGQHQSRWIGQVRKEESRLTKYLAQEDWKLLLTPCYKI